MIHPDNSWPVRAGSGEIIGEHRKRGLGGHAKQATRCGLHRPAVGGD